MANVAVPVEQITPAGIDLTDNGSLSTSNNYQIENDGRVFLHVKKSGAGSCTVTIAIPQTVDGQAVTARTVTVPASTGDRMIGPFPKEIYNDGNGLLNVTFSEITGLTVAAARFVR